MIQIDPNWFTIILTISQDTISPSHYPSIQTQKHPTTAHHPHNHQTYVHPAEECRHIHIIATLPTQPTKQPQNQTTSHAILPIQSSSPEPQKCRTEDLIPSTPSYTEPSALPRICVQIPTKHHKQTRANFNFNSVLTDTPSIKIVPRRENKKNS